MDYDTSDDVRVAVDRKFQARYRDWRNWMHTHYKNCLKKDIDPKTVPFSGVDKDDWVWVIENVYEDEKFHVTGYVFQLCFQSLLLICYVSI